MLCSNGYDGVSTFLEWMYPKGGGDENVESAALGVLILWTTWYVPMSLYSLYLPSITAGLGLMPVLLRVFKVKVTCYYY